MQVFVVQNPEGCLINIRKLAASDITLHGSRFMLIGFGLGTPAMILFGLWLALTGEDTMFFFGLYFLLIGMNYLPLLLYAIAITKKGSATIEVSADLAHNKLFIRKYGIQQLLILVPCAILVISLIQEIKRRE